MITGPNKRGRDDLSSSIEEQVMKDAEHNPDSKRFKGHIELNSLKDEIDLIDQREIIQLGQDRGKSRLWLLCAEAAYNRPHEVDNFFKRLGHRLTMADLRVEALEGPDKGKSLLWVLVCAAALGHTFAYKTAYQLLGKEFTLNDLRSTPQTGPAKGKSVLFMLAVADRQLNLFSQLLYQFGHQMIANDFQTKGPAGNGKDTTVLWQLASHCDYTDAFQILLENFPTLICKEDLLAAPDNQARFQSILWSAAFAAAQGKPNVINSIIDHWGEFITMAQLRQQATKGPWRGATVLNQLAAAAAKGYALPFQKIWGLQHQHIQLKDLLSEGKLIHLLLSAALDGFMDFSIVEKLFATITNLGDRALLALRYSDTLTYEHKLLACSWGDRLIQLIQRKEDFSLALEIFAEQPLPSLPAFNELMALAYYAEIAGYRNAFIELAECCELKKMPDEAKIAFKRYASTQPQMTTAVSDIMDTQSPTLIFSPIPTAAVLIDPEQILLSHVLAAEVKKAGL